MSVSDWTNIVMGLGGLFLLWQQNQIFRQQNDITLQRRRAYLPCYLKSQQSGALRDTGQYLPWPY